MDPLAVHPLVRLQVDAVAGLGSLGAPGLFKRSCLDGDCCTVFWDDLAAPLPPGVGFVSVYSRSDGIVDWHACLDPAPTSRWRSRASHCGMAVQPGGWRAVADALERFRGAPRRAGGRRSRTRCASRAAWPSGFRASSRSSRRARRAPEALPGRVGARGAAVDLAVGSLGDPAAVDVK